MMITENLKKSIRVKASRQQFRQAVTVCFKKELKNIYFIISENGRPPIVGQHLF